MSHGSPNALKLGVAAAALSTDPRQAAQTARQLGFTGVAFGVVAHGLDLTELSSSGRREFRHVLSNANQDLIGLFAELGPKGFGPGADLDRLLARLDRILETAKGLAA